MPTSRVRRCIGLAGGMMAAAALSGCGGAGDGLPRQAISGTVSLGASPLPKGTIQFLPTGAGPEATAAPADGSATGATAASAAITDGKFQVERDRGLIPGPYKVQVYSTDLTATTATDAPPGLEPPPPKETIPRRYNTATTLKAEVTADGPNAFAFQLDK